MSEMEKNEVIKSEAGSSSIQQDTVITGIDEIDKIDSADQTQSITIPISEFATLGSSVAMLMTPLREVSTTVQLDTDGLFRLANSAPGDILKMAEDGNAWGALKSSDGKSKMAKLTSVNSVTGTTTTTIPIDPMMVAMAAMLYSIDRKLDTIVEFEKKIFDFLVNEKESQIEVDVKILSDSLKELKNNWENDVFRRGHYEQALAIKRTAEKNIRTYQRELNGFKELRGPVVANANVNASAKSLVKKFKYYRMSLYSLGLASLIELLMLGTFKEEQLMAVKQNLEKQALEYRNYYTMWSQQIEKSAKGGVERNILKGIGDAGKALGGFIGGIPLVKEGPVDEWLQGGGTMLSKNANNLAMDAVKSLSSVSDPGLSLFTERIDEMNRIYNHTSEICFDKEHIYLVSD